MNTAELRQSFLAFFAGKGHTIVESSSLVPDNDPTLLFTNAGMVQFKDSFAFKEDRGYTRAVSSQRCVRAGGKHNDLDNVGYTARHHTFFEMLGNFSFGDYFKRDAIAWAWEYLTEVLEIPAERLWVTVHLDDDEAEEIWVKEMGVDPNRVTRLGDKDNFWAMGDTGPCGPCSEIFYDHGEDIPGGPPGSEGEDLDRYVEIWNLVFTQFDRSADGTLTPLPKQCVDTGMGLERIAAVMQSVHNNYDTDIFKRLITEVADLLSYEDLTNPSLRVIADHIRSCAFLMSDGVMPSNEGRGYVLRRIIRRALRHGHNLQSQGPFFHKLVAPLGDEMGDDYPLLRNSQDQIAKILLREEQQFELTLDHGMKIFSDAVVDLNDKIVPGELVFKLYDTYGFPVDLTADIAREKGLELDMAGFESAMEAQRERARAASKFEAVNLDQFDIKEETQFLGYENLSANGRVLALFKGDEAVEQLSEGDAALLVVNQSPFYAESGGQVGDSGVFNGDGKIFQVTDTIKEGNAFLHKGTVVEGNISLGDELIGQVQSEQRQAIRLNHSATHLLHAALRNVLGEHVNQRGSLVDAGRLRFDFSHFESVTSEELRQIEQIVNEQIRLNTPVQTEVMDIESARAKGAMALFGEKYSDEVRVLTMGDGFSVELCGGTHASRTGDIGILRILSEQGIASGVRRIEAVTGAIALQQVEQLEDMLAATSGLLKADKDNLLDKLNGLLEQNKKLEKEVQSLNMKLATGEVGDSSDEVREVNGMKYMVRLVDGATAKTLPDVLDRFKNRLQSGVVVLAAVNDGKVALIAGVTKDCTDQVNAGELVNHVALQVGGKGGGRPDMARAGGSDANALPGALESVTAFLEERTAG